MAASERERELEAELERLRKENSELKGRVQKLEELLNAKAKSKESKKPKFGLNYSLTGNEEELSGKRKRKKKSTGRRPQQDKVGKVAKVVDVFPAGADPADCVLRGTQFAWRLIGGQAVYVQYNLYSAADADELPTPPVLRNRRSEYGAEIIVCLAFLHYWIGISIDNAIRVIQFFTGLELSKSQADSLLSQLARDWNADYEAIAELIALQLIVYVDETGWKVNKSSCYTWAYTCTNYVLFRCGVGRDKEEAQKILGDQFRGIGVSDDYSAYKSLFNEHQLCWAHLLRKAIKLALLHPEDSGYREFLDRLYAIYVEAVRYRKDQRLSAGRAQKVEELKAKIVTLCDLADVAEEEGMPEEIATFIKLHRELTQNLECLFVFVLYPEVEPTNNASERNVRREAETRKAGRTSKTAKGAERRSIIMTIFASLRTRLKQFTLAKVIEEIHSWIEAGSSIFQQELNAARAGPKLKPAAAS